MSTSKNRERSFGPVMSMDFATAEPDGNPVASFPPGHVSRMDSSGNLLVYRGAPSAGDADRRPSKLRDAMARISGDNQTLSEKLASINQHNRDRFDQDHPY